MRKLMNGFAVGVGVGYVLGARAGRAEYDRLVGVWNRATGSRAAQRMGEQGRRALELGTLWAEAEARKVPGVRAIAGAVQGPVSGNERVADVMTATVETVRSERTLHEVAQRMKEHDVGAVVVVDAGERIKGIVTDRDLAIRGAAEGRGPETAVDAILSEDLVTVSPGDSLASAVRAMRRHAVRRLPVVVDDRPVGIVSLGDLAIERDQSSALAEISSSAPNR